MGRNCSTQGSNREVVLIDTGLEPGDVHTALSNHPEEAALTAFLDYLFIMDATFIVRTGSSFSGTAASIKQLPCNRATALEDDFLWVCAPNRVP